MICYASGVHTAKEHIYEIDRKDKYRHCKAVRQIRTYHIAHRVEKNLRFFRAGNPADLYRRQ